MRIRSKGSRLNRRFPNGGNAKIDTISWILDLALPVQGQLGITTDEPEKNVGVEEQIHRLSRILKGLQNIFWQRCIKIIR
jgi:hypothetical protein